MYIQSPSTLNAISVGSYAVGIRPVVVKAAAPCSGITATELEPALTAYSVLRLIVTAVGDAPVVLAGRPSHGGPRVSILYVIVFVAGVISATWSWLSCATYKA